MNKSSFLLRYVSKSINPSRTTTSLSKASNLLFQQKRSISFLLNYTDTTINNHSSQSKQYKRWLSDKQTEKNEDNIQKRNKSDSSTTKEEIPFSPSHIQPSGVVPYQNQDNASDHIPQVTLHELDGRGKKRVLVLCCGGTLTMGKDPERNNALRPIPGMLTSYMSNHMKHEMENEGMPDVTVHEYDPLLDSSDLGPGDWAVIAMDIYSNYLHYDGFVVCIGTDTMAYAATAISFMLENLNKPVIFTGSQIPLTEPYNDARRNLIMSIIFAAKETINEVAIFFHDRLLRACRATKVNTHHLMAFDSPNVPPLAKVGISIAENESLALPAPRGRLKIHTSMETRVVTLKLIPGYDDAMITNLIEAATKSNSLKALVLQLYGTGNMPSIKDTMIRTLQHASQNGILVVAATQCHIGSVVLGHYLTGQALSTIGVVGAADMTLEAICCKLGYLFGRGDLSREEIGKLMTVSLRGEVTPPEALPLPPLNASTFDRASRKGKKYY